MDTAAYTKRVLIAALAISALLGLFYCLFIVSGVLIWIGIAIFFAVALNPVVHRVARYMPKKSNVLATLTVLTLLGLIGVGLAYLFLAPLIQQSAALIGAIPQMVQNGTAPLLSNPFVESLGITKDSITTFVHNNIENILGSAGFLASALLALVVSIINNIIALVVIISMIFFMTLEGKRWKSISLRLLPPEHRERVHSIGSKVYAIVTGYVVGNLILSLIFGVSSALVLWVMKSPYFLPLGLAVGLIDLIPMVGSTIGAILVAIVCILTGQYWTAAVFAVFTILYVQLENNVLNPMVYSKSVDISPLVVLLAILLGGALAGIVGALLAIPVAATLQVIAKDVFRERLAEKS